MIAHKPHNLLLILIIAHDALLEELLKVLEPSVIRDSVFLHFVLDEFENAPSDHVSEFRNEV